jgi:hypothetical protein
MCSKHPSLVATLFHKAKQTEDKTNWEMGSDLIPTPEMC